MISDQDDVPESERDPKLQRMVWLFISIYCVATLAGAYCKLTGVF